MAKIVIQNNKICQIEDEKDFNFLGQLDEELSFKIQGAEYSNYYKSGRWDGRKRLLTNNLSFAYGLLERVKNFYKNADKSYDLEDLRSSKSIETPIDISEKLKNLGRVPFPYQLEMLEAAKQNDIGIIRAATGSGKSILCALITAHFGKKTIVYVIGNDLLHQTHKFFSQVFDQEIGKIGDGVCEIRNINVVSVWTAAKALGLSDDIYLDSSDEGEEVSEDKYEKIRECLKQTKVHLLDECHFCSCLSIQTLCSFIDPEHIYGLSASPWRDDNSELLIESVLGNKIINISASYLIEKGYLIKPIIKFIKVPKYPEKLKKNYHSIYKKYIIENDVRNDMVVRAAESLVKQGYQTLVLYSSVAHGKILYDKISQSTSCILLSGKDSSEVRKKAKEQLESGEMKCVIASKIFDIGIDIPSLSGLIIAAGGKSSVRALQRIGRVIRFHKNKAQAAVVEFNDQAAYLSDHSKKRYHIYTSEPAFEVLWQK